MRLSHQLHLPGKVFTRQLHNTSGGKECIKMFTFTVTDTSLVLPTKDRVLKPDHSWSQYPLEAPSSVLEWTFWRCRRQLKETDTSWSLLIIWQSGSRRIPQPIRRVRPSLDFQFIAFFGDALVQDTVISLWLQIICSWVYRGAWQGICIRVLPARAVSNIKIQLRNHGGPCGEVPWLMLCLQHCFQWCVVSKHCAVMTKEVCIWHLPW